MYTEELSQEAAKVLVGKRYDPSCRYQLSQDRYEAAVWKWPADGGDPEEIPIEDTDPVGYDTFLAEEYAPKEERKTYEPVYIEDELEHMDRMYKLRKVIVFITCAIIIAFCCLFTLGVHYGFLKI